MELESGVRSAATKARHCVPPGAKTREALPAARNVTRIKAVVTENRFQAMILIARNILSLSIYDFRGGKIPFFKELHFRFRIAVEKSAKNLQKTGD